MCTLTLHSTFFWQIWRRYLQKKGGKLWSHFLQPMDFQSILIYGSLFIVKIFKISKILNVVTLNWRCPPFLQHKTLPSRHNWIRPEKKILKDYRRLHDIWSKTALNQGENYIIRTFGPPKSNPNSITDWWYDECFP